MGVGTTVVIYDGGDALYLHGRLTAPVLIICIAVALAGFIFGYDLGASGILSSTEPFLKKFFPSVLKKRHNVMQDGFCTVDPSALIACVSSIYFAGTFSALLAGRLTTTAGRKGALIIGGIVFMIGAFLQSIAEIREILILARVIVGFGLGFTNQAAPIYLAEIAPTKWRGATGTAFYFFFGMGVLFGGMSTLFVTQLGENSWRFAFSLSAIPAMIMTVVAFYMPDTPSSLIQRGKLHEALESLNQVRSTESDVDNELEYLISYHEATKNASERPYQMLFERKYRPQLVVATALSSFQLLTGVTVNWNLVPLLDRAISAAHKEIAPVVSLGVGLLVVLSLFVATFAVDKFGRRVLLIQASAQILISQLGMTIVAATGISNETKLLTTDSAIKAKILTVVFGLAYSWCWGPLPWIVSTEILPMEVRAAGHGLSVAINFLVQFITNYLAFPMLCHLNYGTFLFYAVWALIMTLFVSWFVPETKRIPLESMDKIWRSHWYWRRFTDGSFSTKAQIS